MVMSRVFQYWTWAGIGVVALSAAVMSFATLWRLAERANAPSQLAWLLPVAIDATIVLATAVWIAGQAGHRVTRYARGLALCALTLSVAGNAAEHGMTAYGLAAPWWVLVTVSAVPPAALGATVHLAALLGSATRDTTRRTTAAPQRRRQATPKPAPAALSAASAPRREGDKATRMRATFERYRAEGRLDDLSGAELARSADANPSLGRRYLKQWRAELPDTEEEAA